MNDIDMIFLYKENLEEADLSFLNGYYSYDKDNETLIIKMDKEEEKTNE